MTGEGQHPPWTRRLKTRPPETLKVRLTWLTVEEPIIEFKTNWEDSVEKFDDLSLKEEVLRGIYGYGFTRPSPIQMKGILPVI